MPVFQFLRSPLVISVAAVVLLALVVVRSRRALLRPLPLAFLLVGWPLGIWMFVAGDREETADATADLANATGAAQAAIQQRLTTYVDALRSGASFMLASPSISRERWATFAQTLDLPGRYPGVNGIGVSYPVLPGDTDAFLRATRADGAGDFTIRPVPGNVSAADRERFIITFIAPHVGNQQAVGLDVSSEAARRQAAERARDTGEPQLTARIVLVQDGQRRPGFLLYVPVYRVGAPLTTAAERRVALRAWIYAPFVTERFLQAVLGERTDALRLHFFEHDQPDSAHLLYATVASGATLPEFALTTALTLAGQRFTLGWNRGPGFVARHPSPLTWIAVMLALVTPLLVGMAVREETALAAEAGERRYRTLVEWSPEPSYVVRDGTMIYANPAAVKLFGVASRQDLVGSSIFDRVHPDCHELLRSRMRSLAEGAASVPLVALQLLALDGAVIDVESQGTTIDFEGAPATHVTLRDVTAHKRAELSLAMLALRNLTLLQTARDGIHILDEDGRVVEANPAFCAMLGYSRDEMLRLNVADWDLRWTGEELLGKVRTIIAEPQLFETQARRKDGTTLEVEINGVGVALEGRRYLHASARDITGRKKSEADREQFEVQQAYQRKAESLGRMAGAIAHIFNNQLQVVMGNLELAGAGRVLSAATVATLADAMAAARKAADVSGRLVTYLAQTHREHRQLDFSDAIASSLRLLRDALPPQVEVQVDLPSPGPVISANAGHLEQVVTNLMTNAWEASGGEPGIIHLAVTRAALADIPVENRFPVEWQPEAPSYACLTVTDAGGGIAADDISNVFDPFYSTKFTGRGLGLPVSLGIVREHGGVMTVKSAPGAGSVFSVFLPLSAVKVEPAALAAPAHAEPNAGLTA